MWYDVKSPESGGRGGMVRCLVCPGQDAAEEGQHSDFQIDVQLLQPQRPGRWHAPGEPRTHNTLQCRLPRHWLAPSLSPSSARPEGRSECTRRVPQPHRWAPRCIHALTLQHVQLCLCKKLHNGLKILHFLHEVWVKPVGVQLLPVSINTLFFPFEEVKNKNSPKSNLKVRCDKLSHSAAVSRCVCACDPVSGLSAQNARSWGVTWALTDRLVSDLTCLCVQGHWAERTAAAGECSSDAENWHGPSPSPLPSRRKSSSFYRPGFGFSGERVLICSSTEIDDLSWPLPSYPDAQISVYLHQYQATWLT